MNGLSYHSRACKSSLKRTRSALDRVRDTWQARKRRRIKEEEARATETVSSEHSNSSLDSGRPRRDRKTTAWRYQDYVPQLPMLSHLGRQPPKESNDSPELEVQNSEPCPESEKSASGTTESVLASSITSGHLSSSRNLFGLFKTYSGTSVPSHDPDQNLSLEELRVAVEESLSLQPIVSSSKPLSPYYPYPNKQSFELGKWYWTNGIQKSQRSFKDLLAIVGAKDFRPEDVQNTRWAAIDRILGLNNFDQDQDGKDDVDPDETNWEWEESDAGWKSSPIYLDIPFHQRMKCKGGIQRYLAGTLYHRSIISVIVDKLQNVSDTMHFHYEPYELFWSPNQETPDARVYGELYTSQAFHEAHQSLQKSPPIPGCDLPRCVVALMLWSDATHLTSFGNSKLWPSYMFFGNESKYNRCRPSMRLANHIAYFETLPDSFKDFASEYVGGNGPNKTFMAHCNREMFHAQWKIILDQEFMDAYHNGIAITCLDGLKRRFFPRIITYSADYPEKVLLATIRNRGDRPCPRCLVKKSQMKNMGTVNDMKQRIEHARLDNHHRKVKVSEARSLIYDKNFSVTSKRVDVFLKDGSFVPIMNAFSDKLSESGFNFFQMLVVDILHEWEIGTWKATFIHLIRLIYAVNAANVNRLDARFRDTPTFGSDTIRKFSSNSSEMKKLAAHNYEDLLQCAIPVFEELLPAPHNAIVMDLLFTCAAWHGLAKLRMHTDHTLQVLDRITVELGQTMRRFVRETCSSFETRELPREAAARDRRSKAGKNKKKMPNTTSVQEAYSEMTAKNPSNEAGKNKKRMLATTVPEVSSDLTVENSSSNTRRIKAFNLDTYKYHACGDVSPTIRRFGTTDSYNTEIGELEHRTSKARYQRTDRKDFKKQLARIERRQARICRIHRRTGSKSTSTRQGTNLEAHHIIGRTENLHTHITSFVRGPDGHPAFYDFIPKLKKFLLPRMKAALAEQGIHWTPTEPSQDLDWQSVLLKGDRVYSHKIIRVNYTTYDVRRGSDVIHVNTSHCNIMALNPKFKKGSDDDGHPYIYAKVLGIFHANVIYNGHGNTNYHPHRIEFLWVRWYTLESHSPGWKSRRLDRVSFQPLEHDQAFGFMDPSDVIRGCHIIPRFCGARVPAIDGAVDDFVGPRVEEGDKWEDLDEDWQSFYINRFVDRDMLMRYFWGLAVGHIYTHGLGLSDASDLYIDNVETEAQYTFPDPGSGPDSEREEDSSLEQDGDVGDKGGDGSDLDEDDMVYLPESDDSVVDTSDEESLGDFSSEGEDET
ncbi:hypothetical protein DXG01_017109 [Tephrocybe rancida]|nr:hypothetical protein DXG01_017109 [Tephrocybe rancida]